MTPVSSTHLRELNIPEGKAEMAVRDQMEALAAKNVVFPSVFRGAGAYRHYIPSIRCV